MHIVQICQVGLHVVIIVENVSDCCCCMTSLGNNSSQWPGKASEEVLPHHHILNQSWTHACHDASFWVQLRKKNINYKSIFMQCKLYIRIKKCYINLEKQKPP